MQWNRWNAAFFRAAERALSKLYHPVPLWGLKIFCGRSDPEHTSILSSLSSCFICSLGKPHYQTRQLSKSISTSTIVVAAMLLSKFSRLSKTPPSERFLRFLSTPTNENIIPLNVELTEPKERTRQKHKVPQKRYAITARSLCISGHVACF